MMETGVHVLCFNSCKNTNGIVSGSETKSHAPPDWFLFDLVNPPLLQVNHKFGLTTLLKTCRLPTPHGSENVASHLQAQLPEFNHVLWTEPVY